MFLFIIGIVLALVGIVGGLVANKGMFGLILVGVILVALSTATTVPAQNVGVVTQFGKVTGKNLTPGLHSKAPWQRVNDMDGTIQQLNNIGLSADTKSDEADRERGRLTIRLGDNNLMYVDSALRWRIKAAAAPSLYSDYGKGGGNVVETKITSGLVEKELASTLASTLVGYDASAPGAPGQTIDELNAKVKTALEAKIGDKITVESYSIIGINYDQATQERISRIAQSNADAKVRVTQAEADTKVAEQEKLTNIQRAEANEKLTKSLDDKINTARCLDLVDRGKPLPAGFQCFPGSAPARTQSVN